MFHLENRKSICHSNQCPTKVSREMAIKIHSPDLEPLEMDFVKLSILNKMSFL